VTAAQPIARWHTRFSCQLAGSVYAAAPGSRVDAAKALSDAGLDVHVDVMAETEGLPAGVSMAELADIVSAVGPSRVEVHLIGSAEFVDTKLLRVLQLRPAKVFLPWDAFTERRADALHAVGCSAWIALWREWDGLDHSAAPPWPARPDGVLVMLIEPGSRDKARVGQLAVVTACAGDLPVAVDGGVTEPVADLCVAAGASGVVVGRALLGEHAASTETSGSLAISNEGTS
jgi:pentose-5-phosphate-3-epimerase